jgi:hypothetical protein
MSREVKLGAYYQNWKTGGVYRALHIAEHTESHESLVIYCDEMNMWARPEEMFLGKVPEGRDAENVTKQIYRFEECEK